MKYFIVAASAFMAIVATGSALADGMKPGLWEVERRSPELARWTGAMASMPKLRDTMEEVANDAHGTFVGRQGAMVNRLCVTPEQAAIYQLRSDPEHKCKYGKVERSGSTVRTKAQCPGAHVDAELNFSSATSFTGTQVVTIAVAPHPTKETLTGKWLGAKCDSTPVQR